MFIMKRSTEVKRNMSDYLKCFVADNDWWSDNVAEQTRAFFTTICFYGNVIVDTAECDNMLAEIYYESNCPMPYEEFEWFMIKFIV